MNKKTTPWTLWLRTAKRNDVFLRDGHCDQAMALSARRAGRSITTHKAMTVYNGVCSRLTTLAVMK